MNARQIARVVTHSDSPFSLRKNDAVIENVSYGMFSWGEADLIALTKAGYMVEGEIKISLQDLKADLKKKKWIDDNYKAWYRDIKQFYYIVPSELVEEALKITDKAIIEAFITKSGGYASRIHRASVAHMGNQRGRKLFLEERNKLLRLGCFRAWRSELSAEVLNEMV